MAKGNPEKIHELKTKMWKELLEAGITCEDGLDILKELTKWVKDYSMCRTLKPPAVVQNELFGAMGTTKSQDESDSKLKLV